MMGDSGQCTTSCTTAALIARVTSKIWVRMVIRPLLVDLDMIARAITDKDRMAKDIMEIPALVVTIMTAVDITITVVTAAILGTIRDTAAASIVHVRVAITQAAAAVTRRAAATAPAEDIAPVAGRVHAEAEVPVVAGINPTPKPNGGYMITIPQQGIRTSSEEAQNLWALIEKYPLPFGPEYLNYKLKWSFEFAALALREYKKFAFLALVSASEITPSEQIDEVWHLHILHTRDYGIFAKSCGRFLHHSPGMPSGRPQFNRQYVETQKLYQQVFGEEPPASLWPTSVPKPQGEGPTISRVLELYLSKQRQIQSCP